MGTGQPEPVLSKEECEELKAALAAAEDIVANLKAILARHPECNCSTPEPEGM